MAVLTTSGPQEQVNIPAIDLRQFFGTLISVEGTRLAADLAVSQRAAGANMSVDVAAGSCVVQDDHGSGGGFYGFTQGATTNVAIAAADPSNPRVDRIVVQIDDAYYGDADNTMRVKAVKGTPTGGATLANLSGAAAVPGSALLLANVLVGAGVTTITTGAIADVAPVLSTSTPTGTLLCDSGPIGTTQATIDSNTILGGNLPQTYSHLEVILLLKTNGPGVTDFASIRLNNDAGSNYIDQDLQIGANTGQGVHENGHDGSTGPLTMATVGFTVGSAASAAGATGYTKIFIPFYRETVWKKIGFVHNPDAFAAASFDATLQVDTFLWDSTAAITRIAAVLGDSLDFGTLFTAGSRMLVYGIP